MPTSIATIKKLKISSLASTVVNSICTGHNAEMYPAATATPRPNQRWASSIVSQMVAREMAMLNRTIGVKPAPNTRKKSE